MVDSINSKYKLGTLATEFLAGSNNIDLEFLRVRTSNDQYHQLVADANGIRLDSINGSTNTTRWKAALKSDLFSDKGTISTGGDINSAITPGFYRYNGNPANIPQANDWGLLLVYKASNYVLQIAFPGLSRMFVRGKTDASEWSNWSEH